MFSIIAACSLNGGIGRNNTIPWNIPDDLKHFQQITTDCPSGLMNVVIMGKNTWESLPKKPLSKRINIIVSSSLEKEPEKNVYVAKSFEDALLLVSLMPRTHNVFVIGGSSLYNEALNHPNCHKVYITHVLRHIQCDVMFPLETLFSKFPICHEGAINKHNEYLYTFCMYSKE